MSFGKQSKKTFRKKSEIPRKNMFMPLVRDANQCQPGRHWKAYFMFCGPDANGKHCLGNTVAEAQCTGPFKIGWQQVSLRKFRPRDWKGMMNWKESAGSGKVWMVVW